ncbi:hypothetical protein [Galbibacter sp. PAP.153]|uniref:hypothetical protein n=1 Tax=Galbibacter sp. PAP.153 TaxID=3104623 RepID=UPI00300B4AA5
MKAKTSLNDRLKHFETALDNAMNSHEVRTALAKSGYDSKKISEGKKLVENTYAAYRDLDKRKNDLDNAPITYKKMYKEVDPTYREHRLKAKVLFNKDENILKELRIDRSIPNKYTD